VIIEKVEVKHFRCIRNESIELGNLTALLGRNGGGKSAVLYALDVFYDIAADISIEDFFNRDTSSNIEIRVTYGNLRADEKETFGSFIRNDKLIVTKRISYENDSIVQRYYGASLQIQQFAEIRARPRKSERIDAWNQLVANPGSLGEIGPKARSAEQIEQIMNEYEFKHPELLTPIEKEQQFFGAKNFGGGMLDKYTKYVLIPAVRDAADEATGRKSAIYQILDTIVIRKIESRKDIQEFKQKFSDEAKRIYCSDNLKELPELGESLSKTLATFAPGAELILDWDEFDLPEIRIPETVVTLVEDNFKGEISRKGHGLQRALIMTLLQYLATLIPEESEEEDDEETVGEVEAITSEFQKVVPNPDLILTIEEPELYLHPSRCRYLCEILVRLATTKHTLSGGNQVIYTTHSPYFINLNRFDEIRVLRKRTSTDCAIPHTNVTQYSFDQLSKELARICNTDPALYTHESTRAHAVSVMNTIVSEGFFSDVVVLVEGTSDASMLWKVQEIMQKGWAELGITIVPVGGKNNLDRPTLIFQGLSIDTYFIFDGDSSSKGKGNKDERNAVERNRKYLCLANAKLEDFPSTQVHETWAAFCNNLESELQSALGESAYQLIRRQVASELGYSDVEKAIKNIEGASRFIEITYEKGLKVSVLEDIINKVTILRK
jgi:predicted ATPase